MKNGDEILSPNFITSIGVSTSSQRMTLDVATQDNTIAGTYQIDMIAQYFGSERFCSVILEIVATNSDLEEGLEQELEEGLEQELSPKFVE